MTDTDPWTPLSRRAAGLPAHELVEGVPEWLYPQLQQWLYRVLQDTNGPVTALRPGHGYTSHTREAMARLQITTQPWLLPADDPRFLDAIDAGLRWTDWSWPRPMEPGWEDIASLEQLLSAANSAWRATWQGLERRVDPTLTAAVTETIQDTNAEAAGHLAAAWAAAYGRDPDPDKAYGEAVRAVEAVACPLALPSNRSATLGQVRDHLRDAAAKWAVVIPGKDGALGPADPVVAMMTALWEGQRSRHAGTPSSRRQTQAEAQAAVHLAATLVQWLTSGVLYRR